MAIRQQELLTKRGSNTEVLLVVEAAAIERARRGGKLISCLRSITTSAQFNNKFTKFHEQRNFFIAYDKWFIPV